MKKMIILSLGISMVLSGIIINNIKFDKKTITTKPNYYLNNLPVFNIDPIYAYDISTPELAISTSDYAFIAKINKIVSNEYRNYVETEINETETKTVADSYTIYSIEVLKNIKGNLKKNEPIQIEQFGGLSLDKKYYTFFGNSNLLEENSYYLLLGVSPFDGSRVQINFPEKIIKLDIPASIDKTNLNKYIDENATVLQYMQAYKNEKKDVESIWGKYVKHISKDDLEY